MVEIEKYKIIFGEVEFERVKEIFPTFIMIVDVVVGENEQITKELKLLALQQAKIYSHAEYHEYRIKNPQDGESRSLYVSYQLWIDSNLNAIIKLDNENKFPTLKTAKGNKDLLLNQEQLVILFQYLNRMNVFDSKQKLNTKMSIAINLLTGWDKKNTLNIFSEVKEIESASINKHKVCNALKTVIREIEKDLE